MMPAMNPNRACRLSYDWVLAIACCVVALGSAPGQDKEKGPRSAVGIGAIEKTLAGEREIRNRVEAFFTSIEDGKTAEAFTLLMEGSPLGSNKESVDKLVEQTADIVGTYGAIQAHEIIQIKRVGSRLLRFTYFSYSDDYPLKWEFYCFLASSGKWQLLDFSVNNSFEELFDGPTARRARSSITPEER